MDSPPDFDEDDLINDYYEEEPTYDEEAYFEHAMEEANKSSEPQNETAVTSVSQPDQLIHGNAAIETNDDPTSRDATTSRMDIDSEKNNSGDDDVDNDDDESDTKINEFRARQNADNNIYSFERYTSKTQWRKEPMSPNSIYRTKTKNTKRNPVTMPKLFPARTRKAPEARLLELMHQKHAEMPGLTLKYSSRIWRSPIEGKAMQPITLANGSRVYIQVQSEVSTETREGAAVSSNKTDNSTISLGVSMKELRRRSERLMRRRYRVDTNTNQVSTTASANSGQLWVDKHAPSSFPHLLSEERTNREVLRALRAWDPFVFGRDPPARPLSYRQNHPESNLQPENKNDKRPDEKNRVILLAGPPGVGKTTLAHIVARHAGYRPMEVNASDERSSSVLTDSVRRAMESTTINFSKEDGDHGRPNCLILDEIDGADAKGAVQSLVDIIRAEIPPKGSKQKSTYLRRPIIFICNHKYAPSLRPLLPYARHFNVDAPSPARLVARLKAVLSKENMPMSATGSLLHQLVVASGGDIRSCMYTLQFASAEAKDSMEFSNALTTSLGGSGLKDHRNDVASIVTTIFRKTKTSRVAGLYENDRAIVTRVIDSAEEVGDSSALINSLFTNLLRVPYIDPTLDRCASAHELLSSTDLSIGSMDFNASSVAAAIHLLCRVELKPDLSFSTRVMSDAHYKQSANLGLFQRFTEGLPPKCRSLKFQSETLSSDFIPQLAWILSAGEGSYSLCRALSSMDVLTVKERASLEQHVGVLHSLGLTYIVDHEIVADNRSSSYSEMAATRMRLEPPIDRLIQFGHFRAPADLARKEIPSALKELIASQVKLQKIRRSRVESTDDSTLPTKTKKRSTKPPVVKDKVLPSSSTSDKPPSPTRVADLALSAPAPKRLKTSFAPKVNSAANFLGLGAKRARESKSARKAAAVGLVRSKKEKLAHTGSGLLLNEVVRLRHVKGFTQAVHTPCSLKDLE